MFACVLVPCSWMLLVWFVLCLLWSVLPAPYVDYYYRRLWLSFRGGALVVNISHH